MGAYSVLAKAKTENQQSMAAPIEKLVLKMNEATRAAFDAISEDVFAAMQVEKCQVAVDSELKDAEFAVAGIQFGEKPQK